MCVPCFRRKKVDNTEELSRPCEMHFLASNISSLSKKRTLAFQPPNFTYFLYVYEWLKQANSEEALAKSNRSQSVLNR